jgi:hypothetical protein
MSNGVPIRQDEYSRAAPGRAKIASPTDLLAWSATEKDAPKAIIHALDRNAKEMCSARTVKPQRTGIES